MFRKGFTLIELLVVIAIIGIMATVMAPVVGTSIDKARVAKMVALVKTLETACDAYYSDTGAYAYEYSTSSAISYHRLAYDPGTVTGWSGPYIKKPLNRADNPFGTYIYLYSSLGSGFDLNGDGAVDKSGAGNFVRFNASQAHAQRINDIIDQGVSGTWSSTGAVTFSGSTVSIYITGG